MVEESKTPRDEDPGSSGGRRAERKHPGAGEDQLALLSHKLDRVLEVVTRQAEEMTALRLEVRELMSSNNSDLVWHLYYRRDVPDAGHMVLTLMGYLTQQILDNGDTVTDVVHDKEAQVQLVDYVGSRWGAVCLTIKRSRHMYKDLCSRMKPLIQTPVI